MFDAKMKEMQGKVVVTQVPNPFDKRKVVNHIVRNTADDAAVASEMSKHTDIVKFCDMTPVMSAFVASVKTLMGRGNAVRISGLGTFYLKAAEMSESGQSVSEFEVSFTPDKSLTQSVQGTETEAVTQNNTEPSIEEVENMDTMEANGVLTNGKGAEIEGRRLRIAGEGDTDGTGLFMVPCDEMGNYRVDRQDWIKVDWGNIRKNYMTMVSFRVPKGLSGKYRLAIVTRAPLSGSKREDLLIKSERCGVSKAVYSVE